MASKGQGKHTLADFFKPSQSHWGKLNFLKLIVIVIDDIKMIVVSLLTTCSCDLNEFVLNQSAHYLLFSD